MSKVRMSIRITIVVCRWLYRAARTLAAMTRAAGCIAEDQIIHWRSQRTSARQAQAALDAQRQEPEHDQAGGPRPVPGDHRVAVQQTP